jgi:hypothetical protein
VTVLIIIASIASILTAVLQLFGWLKIKRGDVKKFIAIRGRTIAWNAYLIFATLFTIYFLLVLSIVFTSVPFSIGVATLTLLILLALLGTWSPAIQRLHNRRIDTAVNIVIICLLTLTVIGFWIFQWPEIQRPIFVTLLLLAIIVIYIVDRVVKKRKLSRN